MNARIPGAGILAYAALSACTLMPPLETPPPVSDNGAVVALADSARRDSDAGKPDAAAATLERALRIEPHNPGLWHELAQIRLRQGHPDQAASLAAKSNAWAGGDKTLRAANWRLIGEARTQLGDATGAQAAYDMATKLQP
jgi:cytochrome c-type biogenesis protein CcmH/NrfG